MFQFIFNHYNSSTSNLNTKIEESVIQHKTKPALLETPSSPINYLLEHYEVHMSLIQSARLSVYCEIFIRGISINQPEKIIVFF